MDILHWMWPGTGGMTSSMQQSTPRLRLCHLQSRKVLHITTRAYGQLLAAPGPLYQNSVNRFSLLVITTIHNWRKLVGTGGVAAIVCVYHYGHVLDKFPHTSKSGMIKERFRPLWWLPAILEDVQKSGLENQTVLETKYSKTGLLGCIPGDFSSISN